jgi:hypothetical protein
MISVQFLSYALCSALSFFLRATSKKQHNACIHFTSHHIQSLIALLALAPVGGVLYFFFGRKFAENLKFEFFWKREF